MQPIKKKKTRITVIETIIFKLSAELDQVTVKFVSDLQEISLCAIKGVTTDIIVKKPYTQIRAQLLDLIVSDLNPKSIHKKVKKIKGMIIVVQYSLIYFVDFNSIRRICFKCTNCYV